MAHVPHEWPPCQQDERDTLLGPAVRHRSHQIKFDVSTTVVDTSAEECLTSAGVRTVAASLDGFITFSMPSRINEEAVEPIIKQIQRVLHAATKHHLQPEEASQMLEVVPPEPRFLLYYRDAQFDRDLERHRL